MTADITMRGGQVTTGYRLGIDIGGTFTDVMLADEHRGVVAILKTPSVPAAPEQAIFNSIDTLVQRGIDPGAVTLFVHGTTLAVNTLIERSGAETAFGRLAARLHGQSEEARPASPPAPPGSASGALPRPPSACGHRCR